MSNIIKFPTPTTQPVGHLDNGVILYDYNGQRLTYLEIMNLKRSGYV